MCHLSSLKEALNAGLLVIHVARIPVHHVFREVRHKQRCNQRKKKKKKKKKHTHTQYCISLYITRMVLLQNGYTLLAKEERTLQVSCFIAK
jgi:hypothetical protein